MNSDKNLIKVSVVQDAPVFLDKDATVEKACKLIKEAASKNAKLVLFPETFISAYPDWVWSVAPSNKKMIGELYSALYDSAVTIPDDATTALCKAAKEASIYVVVGINERSPDSSNTSLYNSMLYISPEGKVLGTHRKLMPTGGERLMWAQGDGNNLVSFDTDIGRIGGLICWENFMPLPRVAMYQTGVQIYMAPTWDSSEQWLTAMRHIAREGGMFVMGCCQAIRVDDVPDKFEFKKLYAEDREWVNKGNSCIVDPMGNFLAEPLEAKKDILYADIDLSEIPTHKWMFDVNGHYSRPDVFDFKVNK